MDLHVPSMPAMAKYFDAPDTQIQYTITLFLLGFSLFHLVLGPLSDRYGRRPILIISLMTGLVGSVMCMLAYSIPFLLWGRFIAGIGCGGASLLARAMMKDAFSGNDLSKYSSFIGIVISITIGLAPAVGGFAQQYGHWRLNFGIASILLLSVFIYIFFRFPETHQRPNAYALHFRTLLSNFQKPLKSRHFWGYTMCSGIAFSGIMTYATAAPFILQVQLGVSAAVFGLLSIFIAIAQSGGFSLNIRYLPILGLNRAILVGLGFMLLAGLFLIIIASTGFISVPSIILAIVFYATGAGFIFSNAYAGAFDNFGHIAGVCAAVYGLLQMGLGSLTTFIVAKLKEGSSLDIGFVFTGLAILGAILYHFLIHRAPKKIAPGW